MLKHVFFFLVYFETFSDKNINNCTFKICTILYLKNKKNKTDKQDQFNLDYHYIILLTMTKKKNLFHFYEWHESGAISRN